jgi:hypothetical protein
MSLAATIALAFVAFAAGQVSGFIFAVRHRATKERRKHEAEIEFLQWLRERVRKEVVPEDGRGV